MGVGVWLIALVFLTLASTSARAIDCSADSAQPSAYGFSPEYLICSDAELAELERENQRLVRSVGSAMPPDRRKILAEAFPDLAGAFSFCHESRADCIAMLRDEARSRLRFLNAEPDSGPGTGEHVVLLPFYSKLTNTGRPSAMVVQRFADPRTPGSRAYNAIVDGIVARNRQTSGEEANYLLSSLVTTFASDRLMSVEHRYSYMQGEGGHDPTYGLSNFNIDMRSGKELDLADVFPPDHMEAMKANCVNQLVNRIRDKRAADGDAGEYAPQGPSEVSSWMSELFSDSESWSFRESEAIVTFDRETMDEAGAYYCRFSADEVRRQARAGAPVP